MPEKSFATKISDMQINKIIFRIKNFERNLTGLFSRRYKSFQKDKTDGAISFY